MNRYLPTNTIKFAVGTAIASRLLISLLAIVFGNLIPDCTRHLLRSLFRLMTIVVPHDGDDVKLIELPQQYGYIEGALRWIVGMYAVWDGAYYLGSDRSFRNLPYAFGRYS